MDCNKSFLEKEQIAQEKRDVITELKKLQEDHKASSNLIRGFG